MGTASVAVDLAANTLTMERTFHGLLAAETDAHIHGPAPLGSSAGVKFGLPLGNNKVGVWNYPESDEAAILGGLMYFNVHSANFGSGEIRGQILNLTTNVSSYCQAKVTSLGCIPAISGVGGPSASAGSGFAVSTLPVPGCNVGIYIYFCSKTGPANLVFQGGVLCLAGAVTRTPGQVSGGTLGVCDGAYGIDFNALVAGGSDAGLVAGALVFLQTWFGDVPASFGSGLRDALKFELLP